jgi:glycosyltransferase involved in cell wall biosynthesis
MRQPLVTLCVPAYNAEQTLAGTLESLLRQTYQPIEIHVVDDASTDATAAIARSFGPTVSVHTNPTNLGLRRNWEKCMRLGTGEYRALYHADDLYEPDIVGTEVAFLEAHPEVGVVFSAAWLIDENGAPRGRSRTLPQLGCPDVEHVTFSVVHLLRSILRYGNFLIAPSAMVRAGVQAGFHQWGSDPSFSDAADLDAWLEIARHHEVGLLARPLMKYRLSPQQHSYRYHRARTEPSELLRLMDRWLNEEGVRDHVTESDRALRAELGRRDRIERAARALLLDRVGLACRLLAEAAETRGYPRSRSSLKYSLLALATAAACWPWASEVCKPVIARTLTRKRAW